MRYDREASIVTNSDAAKKYIPHARTLLGKVKNETQHLDLAYRTIREGNVLYTFTVIHGAHYIRITVVEEEEEITSDEGILYLESGGCNNGSVATMDCNALLPATIDYGNTINVPVSGRGYLGKLSVPITTEAELVHENKAEGESLAVGCDPKLTYEYTLLGDYPCIAESPTYCGVEIYVRKLLIGSIPASLWSGKMRAWVQALYGSLRTDLMIGINFAGIPELWVGEYKIPYRSNFTPILYTGPDYQYFFIIMDGYDNRIIRGKLSKQGEKLRKWLIANEKSVLNGDPYEINKVEGYLLSELTFDDESINRSTGITDVGEEPIYYGWHASYDGSVFAKAAFIPHYSVHGYGSKRVIGSVTMGTADEWPNISLSISSEDVVKEIGYGVLNWIPVEETMGHALYSPGCDYGSPTAEDTAAVDTGAADIYCTITPDGEIVWVSVSYTDKSGEQTIDTNVDPLDTILYFEGCGADITSDTYRYKINHKWSDEYTLSFKDVTVRSNTGFRNLDATEGWVSNGRIVDSGSWYQTINVPFSPALPYGYMVPCGWTPVYIPSTLEDDGLAWVKYANAEVDTYVRITFGYSDYSYPYFILNHTDCDAFYYGKFEGLYALGEDANSYDEYNNYLLGGIGSYYQYWWMYTGNGEQEGPGWWECHPFATLRLESNDRESWWVSLYTALDDSTREIIKDATSGPWYKFGVLPGCSTMEIGGSYLEVGQSAVHHTVHYMPDPANVNTRVVEGGYSRDAHSFIGWA